MGVIIPVNYGQVTLKLGLIGHPTDYVITCGIGPLVGANPSVLAAAISALWQAPSRPLNQGSFLGSYTYKGCDVTVMTATGPILGSFGASITGTLTGSAPPPNVAYLVKKETERGGRKGRGRFYLPPIHNGESLIDASGVIDASSVTAIQAWYTNLQTAWAATTFGPVLLHEDGSTPDAITGLSFQSLVATQRRRLRN